MKLSMLKPRSGDILLPVLFAGFLYWCISQYGGSFPDYRDTLATGAMAVAGMLLALNWMRGNAMKPLSARVASYWLAFFMLAFLSSSLSTNSLNAFSQLRLYCAVFFLSLAFRGWVDAASRKMITGFLMAFCLVHVLILMVVLGHASRILPASVDLSDSVPYHGNIRHVAYHGMLAACAGLALFFVGGKVRLAGYFLGLVSTFGLVFLGQRGGLLGLFVFVAVSVAFLPGKRRQVLVAALLALSISLAATYLLDRSGIRNQYAGSIVERIRVEGGKAITGSSGRLAIWKSSMEMSLDRPFVGYGPDGFRTSTIGSSYTHIQQPHNVLLQALVEFGYPGLILVLLFAHEVLNRPFACLREARQNGCEDVHSVILFAILMGFLAYCLVDGLFYHGLPLLTMALLAPLTVAAIPYEDSDRRYGKTL